MRIYRASLITPSVLGLCAAVSITPRLAPVEVVWSPCRSTGRHECATIRVPLDWADESKGMIPLALARLPAATSPREGFMFINPGGPGASGTSMILTEGQGLQSLLGRGWDIVSWDPSKSQFLFSNVSDTRQGGISASGPNITLFSNDDQYNAFWAPLFGTGRLVAHGNLTTSSDVDFLSVFSYKVQGEHSSTLQDVPSLDV
ncbi:hypothetical protein FRC18_002802 [Serendipita sp. 400]|nr:hypothetical protein FRC18_002802 [Serendipita sp. 400]